MLKKDRKYGKLRSSKKIVAKKFSTRRKECSKETKK
jgi:hypothetical protein